MYYIRTTDQTLGEYIEFEVDTEEEALDVADSIMRNLWIANRDYCDFFEINELVERIMLSVEIEQIGE